MWAEFHLMTVWVMKINSRRIEYNMLWPYVLKWRGAETGLVICSAMSPTENKGGERERIVGIVWDCFVSLKTLRVISRADKNLSLEHSLLVSSFFSHSRTLSPDGDSCGPILPSSPLQNCMRHFQPTGSFGYHLDLPHPTGNVNRRLLQSYYWHLRQSPRNLWNKGLQHFIRQRNSTS